MLAILGLAMLYAIIHSYIVLFKYAKKATFYENFISTIGAVIVALLLLNLMFNK